MRLLFISDFTEQFSYRLLKGILKYSQDSGEPWVVCKMPSSYKRQFGLRQAVTLAEAWNVDVVIGQFEPDDDLSLFQRKGMVVLAQDYITKFSTAPNITADYHSMGAMAAEVFLSRGFRSFAYFGNNGMCWSDERRDGFRRRLEDAGYGKDLYIYDKERGNNLWYFDLVWLQDWLEALPRPVGIMACDDNQASILVEACRSMGIRIPFDVAIIGVDNDEVVCGMADPAITSIDVDIERGGYEAAEMAERMVRDPAFKGHDIVLRPLAVITRTSTNVMATGDRAVQAALQFINDNIDHKILVSDILEVVPMSRRLLEKRFLKATGMSIHQYITQLKVNRFAQLLLSSKDSIADITARMDEQDPKRLARSFTALKGCTPADYRRRKTQKNA